MSNRLPVLNIENAQIRFRNFSGKEGRYNPVGDRNFVVFIDSEDAVNLEKDGWNIKYLQPRDEQDIAQAYLPVAVSFRNIPPRIILITNEGRNKTMLGEDSVDILDWADIANADIQINPSFWEVGGKSGIKAYLKKAYIVLEEDELDKKYYDVPDSGTNFGLDIDSDDTPF